MLQSRFNIGEAGGGGAMGCCRDGLGGEVDLSVIGVAVKTEAMLPKDWTKWENVKVGDGVQQPWGYHEGLGR